MAGLTKAAQHARTLVFAAWAVSGLALADSPAAPPALHRAVSPNGRFAVISDPDKGTKLVDTASGATVCETPHWFRPVFVADDGVSFAIWYSNLVPLNVDDSLEVLSIWRDCRKVKAVTFGSVVPDRSILRRTASHYAWSDAVGQDQSGHLVVTRIDGHIFRFNISNGEAE
ncbi:MAG TPA: hypothetical protein VMV94_09590 [Phycisphaerae bacterium]|nr:hypothetical protein [Phycisphaerae bacterium]